MVWSSTQMNDLVNANHKFQTNENWLNYLPFSYFFGHIRAVSKMKMSKCNEKMDGSNFCANYIMHYSAQIKEKNNYDIDFTQYSTLYFKTRSINQL